MAIGRTFADEINETCSVFDASVYRLGGANIPYRQFREGYINNSDGIYYGVRNKGNTKWELHRNETLIYGSPDVLSRTNVFLSTNSNGPEDWEDDDLPLIIYVPSSADVLEGVLTGFLGTAVHSMLKRGASWSDSSVASTIIEKLFLGTDSAEKGRAYDTINIFSASERTKFEDKGAANYVLTVNDLGKTLTFDCTAAGRTLTMLASTVTGMGHGAYVYVYPYGSTVNGVTILPGGAETADVAYAPPMRRSKFIWDGARSTWVTDATDGHTTGDVKLCFKTTADIGWIMLDDTTIGNTGSGATRTGVIYQALYTALWNAVSSPTANAACAVTGGLGANAAADWAANKKMDLPKVLGRALALAGTGSGLTARALGTILGAETHSHSGTTGGPNDFLSRGDQGGGAPVASQFHSHAFTTSADSSYQPTTFMNAQIKL